MADNQLIPYVFPTLVGGWDPAAPPRSLGPNNPRGDLWADIHNFRAHEGRLRRRAAMVALDGGGDGTITYPTVLFNNRVADIGNAQVPVVISSVNPSFDDFIVIIILVTSREIYFYRAGVWKNITPVYEVGSVNVTNGSTTVTAAGGSPNWLDNAIAFNLIELPKGSNSWYQISAWTNTTLTLATAYTGTTLVAGLYSIRRTMWGNVGQQSVFPFPHYFAQVFNNDLYLAGPSPGGAGSNVWVLKAENIWGFPAPTTCSILACSSAIQSGVDVLPSTGISPFCTGLAVLDDGRVVIGLISDSVKSRIYYSSHLNPAVWSASPGGFTDVTAVPGTLRAIGRLSSNVTLHYDNGIALGVPTGQDDPPLAFRPTTAQFGCAAARTLKRFEGVEAFLAADFNAYTFDCSSIHPIGDPLRFHLRDRRRARVRLAHAAVDPYRREYHVYLPQISDTASADLSTHETAHVNETLRFIFSAERGSWSKDKFPLLVNAASDGMDGEPIDSSSNYRVEGARYRGACIVGIPSYDPKLGGATTGLATTNMLFKLSEASTTDASIAFTTTGVNGGVYAETGDFDCDKPAIDKTVSHVTVWFFSATTETETFEVAISKDSGTTWVTDSQSLSLVANTEIFKHFFFEPATSEQWRIRLRCPAGSENGMAACPTRMIFWYSVATQVEAVER